MDDRDVRCSDAYTRGQSFCRDKEADFAPTSDFRTHYAALDTALTAIGQFLADHIGGRNASKTAILDAIRIDCRNIRRTAVTRSRKTSPALPIPSPRPSITTPASSPPAMGYLLKFEPASDPAKAALAARFILKELPATFVADLRTDSDLYGPADATQETKRCDKVQDTAAIELALSDAGKQIRYLNAIMNNKYSRDAEKLRGWKSAIHVERDPKKKKKDGGGSGVA